MEQQFDPPTMSIAKPNFVLGNILFIALFFLGGHVGLVKLYGLGEALTTIVGAVLTSVIISMLIWQKEDRFSPLVVGVLLWAVLGEVVEQLGFGSIVRVRNFVLLFPTLMFIRHMARRERLPDFLNIALVFFMTIWACHFVLVNILVHLGPTHLLTYASSSLFLAMFVLAISNIRQSDSRAALTIQSVFVMCSAWSMLEYLWAWKVLPKPW